MNQQTSHRPYGVVPDSCDATKALSTLTQKTETVSEKWDSRRKVRLSSKTARQRRNSATVALFCDSVDRLLVIRDIAAGRTVILNWTRSGTNRKWRQAKGLSTLASESTATFVTVDFDASVDEPQRISDVIWSAEIRQSCSHIQHQLESASQVNRKTGQHAFAEISTNHQRVEHVSGPERRIIYLFIYFTNFSFYF